MDDTHYGHCDTCGTPCDEQGCTFNRGHVIAWPSMLDDEDVWTYLKVIEGSLDEAYGYYPDSVIKDARDMVRDLQARIIPG